MEDKALDLLEELLGMVEPLTSYLSPEDYERFREICSKTADLREGTTVNPSWQNPEEWVGQ